MSSEKEEPEVKKSNRAEDIAYDEMTQIAFPDGTRHKRIGKKPRVKCDIAHHRSICKPASQATHTHVIFPREYPPLHYEPMCLFSCLCFKLTASTARKQIQLLKRYKKLAEAKGKNCSEKI